jgi:predicted RecA/RadA family phage recombinase
MKNRIHDHQQSDTLQWTNGTGATVPAGRAVPIGTNILGIAQTDIANGATGIVQLRGRFLLPKATGAAINQGAILGWDNTNFRVNTSVATTVLAQLICTKTAASADTEVEVEIVPGLRQT